MAVASYDVCHFAVNVVIHCTRLESTFETWQTQTFEKISAANQAAWVDYYDKIASANVSSGVNISGQNPGINRIIEKTELKKSCISLITNQFYDSFDAMRDPPTPPPTPPQMDILEAIKDGEFIQFFEQAFEWDQITYIYYPYFWGRKSKHVENSTLYDTDPLFTQFLQAGAAT